MDQGSQKHNFAPDFDSDVVMRTGHSELCYVASQYELCASTFVPWTCVILEVATFFVFLRAALSIFTAMIRDRQLGVLRKSGIVEFENALVRSYVM